ncbi:ATP-grasp fold amidoligase family protein [Phaeodactylibacter sp.]|uniref:ATP-grasp fold amidoligase family protein n=1 Tax=Phaeodactylibacter sp. TaxID=1940289 RepID=UPI0025CFCAD0|nr:ATP-grasp fold amidoligase family protein [Phaeodactylibacter sp.]MCI5090791.1 hypothetical protein [Phaeodactylibacter sp.]
MNVINRIHNKLLQTILPDADYLSYRFEKRMNRKLDLNTPVSFNEKIQWLKLNGFKPEMTSLADKVAVKDYVGNILSNKNLIPTLAVYSRGADIKFDHLPSEFILKASHGSGWNFIVTDKEDTKENEAQKYFNYWLSKNYYPGSREKPYKNIPPRVIAEPLIRDLNGELPKDYKVFCFSGEPLFIQVDIDRFSSHTRVIYNTKWEKQPYSIGYKLYSGEVTKPKNLEALLDCAKKLSKSWPFVRIDFYLRGQDIFFGEFTFYPGGGMEKFTDYKWDIEWGQKITLERPK